MDDENCRYGYDYDEDDEEQGFRPEDVLDPQWEKQQKKVSEWMWMFLFPGLFETWIERRSVAICFKFLSE